MDVPYENRRGTLDRRRWWRERACGSFFPLSPEDHYGGSGEEGRRADEQDHRDYGPRTPEMKEWLRETNSEVREGSRNKHASSETVAPQDEKQQPDQRNEHESTLEEEDADRQPGVPLYGSEEVPESAIADQCERQDTDENRRQCASGGEEYRQRSSPIHAVVMLRAS